MTKITKKARRDVLNWRHSMTPMHVLIIVQQVIVKKMFDPTDAFGNKELNAARIQLEDMESACVECRGSGTTGHEHDDGCYGENDCESCDGTGKNT